MLSAFASLWEDRPRPHASLEKASHMKYHTKRHNVKRELFEFAAQNAFA